MRSAALLLLLAQVAFSFVLPIKLAAVVNQTEQAEVITLNDYAWTTTVIVGTPGTAFTVVIDTTSSILVVPDNSSGRNNSFDASQSSTYLQTPDSFVEVGHFGKFVGSIGNDTVILGESFSNNNQRTSITVPFATFAQATIVGPFLPDGVDGILGLAFPALAPYGSSPVFTTAIKQKDVAIGTFVIWLEDQWESSDNGTHGVIYYGNVDYLHCNADQRKMYPLSSATTFKFVTPSFTASGAANYTYNKKTITVIDSTSSYIGVPSTVLNNVFGQMNLNPDIHPTIVPCDTKIDLAFNFRYGTEHVTELNLVMPYGDGTCWLALMRAPLDNTSGSEQFVLGYSFLRGRCTFFDVSNQEIGFSEPLTHGRHISL